MIPGSHRLGQLNHYGSDGYSSIYCQEREHWDASSGCQIASVPLECRRGGVTLHHALTLHMSDDNVTGASRRGPCCHYAHPALLYKRNPYVCHQMTV